jgi:hypothetical protein
MEEYNFIVQTSNQELMLLSSLVKAEAFLLVIDPFFEYLSTALLESLVGN